MNKLGDNDKLEFLKSVQAKLFTHIGRYTNEMVTHSIRPKLENFENKAMEIKSNKYKTVPIYAMNKKNNISEITKPQSSMNLIISNVIENNKQSCINENSDEENSYHTSRIESRKNKKIKKDKLMFGMVKKGKEMIKIYQRMDDLRNLEMNYFKEKKKAFVKNEEFNEIFFNFQKKYNKGIKQSRAEAMLIEKQKSTSRPLYNKISLQVPPSTSSIMQQSSKNESDTKENKNRNTKLSVQMHKEFLKELMNDDILRETDRISLIAKPLKQDMIRSISNMSSTMFSSDIGRKTTISERTIPIGNYDKKHYRSGSMAEMIGTPVTSNIFYCYC